LRGGLDRQAIFNVSPDWGNPTCRIFLLRNELPLAVVANLTIFKTVVNWRLIFDILGRVEAVATAWWPSADGRDAVTKAF
jgi:hypothetical protein